MSTSLAKGVFFALLLVFAAASDSARQTASLFKLEKNNFLMTLEYQYVAALSATPNMVSSRVFPIPFLHLAHTTNFSFYEAHLVQGRWDDYVKRLLPGGLDTPSGRPAPAFKSAFGFPSYDGGLTFKASEGGETQKLVGFLGGFLCSGTDRLVKNMFSLRIGDTTAVVYSADPMNYICYDNMVHLFDLLRRQHSFRSVAETIPKSCVGQSPYTQLDLAQTKNATHTSLSLRITIVSTIETMRLNSMRLVPIRAGGDDVSELRVYHGSMQNFTVVRIGEGNETEELISEWAEPLMKESAVRPIKDPLLVRRQLTGVDHELYSTYVASVHNAGESRVEFRFQEYLPHFLKPYFHSLELWRNGQLVTKHYRPALVSYNSKSDCYFDLGVIELAPGEEIQVRMQLEKMLLPFEEYPHDSSRGFDLPQTVFFYRTEEDTEWRETYVASTVLVLPQPDFSMPFNVHALYCVICGILFKLYLTIINGLA